MRADHESILRFPPSTVIPITPLTMPSHRRKFLRMYSNGRVYVGQQLSERRNWTTKRLEMLRDRLRGAEARAAGKACVYATGSFGRCEASTNSDLDLFIVGKSNGKPGRDGKEGSLLSRLDEICIKADLIQVTRELNIPEFSWDGQYLEHYS